MTKEQNILLAFVAIACLIVGSLIGILIADCTFSKVGITQTTYCKEVQIDTIQYNYQKDMYKYQIKLIK
jgi:uncharacterized membrane protein YraQ (UPF0718 family)